MSTPKIRFKGFDMEWNLVQLGDLMAFNNGINADKSSYGHGRKFINVLDILNNNLIKYDEIIGSVSVSQNIEKTNRVEYGDLLFLRSSETREDVGKSSVYLDEGEFALFGGFVIRGKKLAHYDPYFLKLNLESPKVRHQISSKAGGSTRFNVSQSILNSIKINMPSKIEQEKVADFIGHFDIIIKLQKEKIDLLKKQKKGFMQKIFAQELRFKDKNGRNFPDWKTYKLSDFSTRVTKKNSDLATERPLTISAQHGLIDQIEYFNKNVASSNLKGYYLLQKGEFAYNKSYSKGFPFGTIKRLDSYENGALSTLYICFVPKNNINSDFLVHYFDSTQWHKEVSLICVEGARNHGLLNVSVSDFFDTEHQLPCKEEQIVIADFINSINIKIKLNIERLIELQFQKKALMQQMFI
jgi:type I restriction enzyme, S subunit